MLQSISGWRFQAEPSTHTVAEQRANGNNVQDYYLSKSKHGHHHMLPPSWSL